MASVLGQRYGRLYYFKNKTCGVKSKRGIEGNLGLASNRSDSTTIDIWHRGFCHRILDEYKLKYISDKVREIDILNKDRPNTSICGTCAMGRQHKESATRTGEKAEDILEIVHLDLYGPMQTVGLSGEHHFITIINKRSGRISLPLLRTKDEALTAFKIIRALAEKSSGKEVKIFCSDGGGEYVNKEFKKYLQVVESLQRSLHP